MKKCFENLFKPIKESAEDTFMTQILGKIWNDYKGVPKIHVAFTISVCKTILDPATANITIDTQLCQK